MAKRVNKAIFTREFHWSRPNSPLGFGARPSPEPQTFPRDFIDAAIRAGAAQAVPQTRSARSAEDEEGTQ